MRLSNGFMLLSNHRAMSRALWTRSSSVSLHCRGPVRHPHALLMFPSSATGREARKLIRTLDKDESKGISIEEFFGYYDKKMKQAEAL